MKKLLGATAALAFVALTAPAYAADLPVKAPPVVMPALYNWSGIYIGVEGGAVMGQTTDWFFLCSHCSTSNFGHPLHGGFVGGEAGIDWQPPGNRWVFGIVGDGSWSELEEALNCANLAFSCGSKITSFGTVRARIGYAFGPTGSFLVYLTGGWAWAHVDEIQRALFTPFTGVDFAKNVNGWTVGGGAEYGITPYLSVKGEILYVNLERQTFQDVGTVGVFSGPISIKSDFVLARMALDWRFNWGKAAPVVARY